MLIKKKKKDTFFTLKNARLYVLTFNFLIYILVLMIYL